MPYVNLQITPGATREQRQTVVREFTETLVRVLGKDAEHTHIVIQEVPDSHWGVAARLADDYRRLKRPIEAPEGPA